MTKSTAPDKSKSSTTAGAATTTSNNTTTGNTVPELNHMEEDDEFEEFPTEMWYVCIL